MHLYLAGPNINGHVPLKYMYNGLSTKCVSEKEIASRKDDIEKNIKSTNRMCDIWPSKQLGLGMAVHGVQGEAWKRTAAGTKAHLDFAGLPDGEPEDAVSNI